MAPRLANGRFASRDCPECGCGTLQQIEPNVWECDGLADPENNQAALEPCEYALIDGLTGEQWLAEAAK